MELKHLSLLILFIGKFFFVQAQNTEKKKRPNFVFILTDDHRYDLLGCTGNKIIQTPELDKLASEGVLFTNGHVTSAICTPSRVSILLSQYERKHGVNFNSGTSVSDEAWKKSYPVIMRENGYYTGYIGKNHSPVGQGGYQNTLMEKSFDYWYGSNGHLFFYPKEKHKIFRGAKSETQAEILTEGVTDFFSNERRLEGAKSFIDKLPLDKPFCLSLCFNLPHGAATSRMEQRESDPSIYKTLYRDIDIPLSKHYIAKKDIKKPKLPANLMFANDRQLGYNFGSTPESMKERKLRHMQGVTGVDKLIGNLRKTLKEKGLDDNTIIVFTSDHGLFWGEFGLVTKALCYEICTKVPLIIYNPLTPKKKRQRVTNQLAQTIDIAPTLLDYAGIEIPKNFQGKSLKPILEDSKSLAIHEYLYTENLWSTTFGNPRCEAVQNKEWKYIRYYKNDNKKSTELMELGKPFGLSRLNLLYYIHDYHIPIYRSYIENPLKGEQPVYEELYNLKNDPDEVVNLIDKKKNHKIIEKMRKVWKEKITYARGSGPLGVLRYTYESKLKK